MANPTPFFSSDKGALGGFFEGLNNSYAKTNADKDLIDRDRRSAFDQAKFDQYQTEGPLRAIENANKMAEAEMNMQDINSGAKRELMDAERNMKIQQVIEMKSKSEKAEMEKHSQAHVQAGGLWQDGDEANNLLAMAKWDESVRILERAGVKDVPKQYSIDNLQKLKMRAKAAEITIPHLHKMEEVAAERKFRAEDKVAERDFRAGQREFNAEDAMERAKVNAAAAGVRSAATIAGASDRKGEKHNIEKELFDAVEAGKTITQSRLEQYKSLSLEADDKLQKAIDKATPRIATDLAAMNKEKRQAIAAEAGDKNMPIAELADKIARQMITPQIENQELSKFNGAKVKMRDGSEAIIKGGQYVPVGGGAPVAPPSKPMAPTDPRRTSSGVIGGQPSSSGPIRVKSVQEAAALPPGTKFIDTDGVERTRK